MMWIEKGYFVEMLKGLEQRGLSYVENITWVILDESKKEEVNKTGKIVNAFSLKDAPHLRSCKKTLYFFRKRTEKPLLELRH